MDVGAEELTSRQGNSWMGPSSVWMAQEMLLRTGILGGEGGEGVVYGWCMGGVWVGVLYMKMDGIYVTSRRDGFGGGDAFVSVKP